MKFIHYIKDIAMKKLLSLLWILWLLFILPVDLTAAGPNDSIGSVVAIRGKVTAVSAAGAVRKLTLKASVYLKDTLKTEKRSRLQVMFLDNTIVSLGPNSEMKIAEYQWKPEKNAGGMKTKVKEGVFRIMGGAITKVAPENFTTETPAATIGIRGSMYAGRVSNDTLTVVFQGGKGIFVTNPAGTVEISIPGYGTRVEGPAEPPETPQPLSSEEITDLNNALSAQEQEDASDNDDSSDTTESKENTETDTDNSTDDEDSDDTDEPAREEKDDSLLAADTPSTENDDGTTDDADTVAVAAPAESAAQVITNDLDNELSTDKAAGGGDFIGTVDAIADSLNTINDTLKNNAQEDLTRTEVAPVVSAKSNPVETVTTTEALTTTTTIITAVTTTTTIQTTTTTDPPPLPPPTIANFTGKYMAVQFDNDTGTSTGDAIWSGDIAPDSTDGSVQGTVVAVEDSKNIPYLFQIATFDDTGTYTGETIGVAGHVVNLTGQLRTFNTVDLHWSDLGEFVAFYLPESSFDGGNYKFQELGFAGIPSASLPSNGVEAYSGHVLAAFTEAGNIDADTSVLDMEVNWYNEKVLGRIHGTDSKIFFIGKVSGNALSNVQFFGDGKAGATPTAADGTVDFGKFYGSQHQGFGMTASGDTYDVYNQASENTWSAVGAGFRVYENPLDDPVAPTGAATLWEGFTTGLAEDMDDPPTNRRLYLSSVPSDLQFSVDKDAGTLSGTLSASDVFPSGYLIVNMVVGDTNGSAFVLNDNFGAGLGDGGGTVITDGTDDIGLRTYGNYMVSMPPDSQFSEYVTWGYWEAAYLDPATPAKKYHIHQPGSLWIAGERTPVGYIQNHITNNTFVGTYQGPAHGIEISAGGVVSELTNGSTNLTIDFSQAAVADEISGTIGFDQASFTAAGLTATSGGFTANFTDANVNTSTVNGAYFGPNAEAIGGNFHTDLATGERYMGVFGGNKVP